MARTNIERIDPPQFSTRAPGRVELRRGQVVRAYLLRLLYDFVVTGGTGAGSVYDDAHSRLIRRIQWRVGGTDILSISGQFLGLYHLLMGSEEHVQTPPANLNAGTQVDRELMTEIPLYMPHSLTPDAFAAPTGVTGFPTPELIITWGDAGDMVTGEDGTVSIENATAELFEVFHEPPVSAPPGGFGMLRATQYVKDVQQSGPLKLQLTELEPGDEIRAVFVESLSGGVAGTDHVYDDALVSSVRLTIGTRAVRETVPFRVVQQENRRTYALDSIVTGLAVLDAAEDRDVRPGRLWTVAGRQTPTVEVEAVKQAGECLVRATVIYTRGRLAAR